MTEKKPLVTVVMPCLNEEKYVGRALRSLFDEWSIKSCEFLVVDGGSTDRTRAVVEELKAAAGGDVTVPGTGAALPRPKDGLADDVLWFASERGTWVRESRDDRYAWNPPVGGRRQPVIRILDNPGKTPPCGMNVGILEARGAYIARADAHCTYSAGYIRRCVELLEQKEAANAGGVQVPVAEGGEVQRAIALALEHPAGMGECKFRKPGYSGPAEGAKMGTYRKGLFDELGLFDAKAWPNEDSDLNIRIVMAGKKIWVDSAVKVFYYPRKTFKELAGQFFRYGAARARTTKKHKMFTSWRQIVPPLLVAMMAYSIVRSVKAPICLLFFAAYAVGMLAAAFLWGGPKKVEAEVEVKGMGGRAGGVGGGIGAGVVAGATGKASERGPGAIWEGAIKFASAGADAGMRTGTGTCAAEGIPFETRLRLAAALAIMHVTWGAGFLWGLVAKW